KNTSSLARAWVVHQMDVLPPLRLRRPSDIAERTADVLFPEEQPRDFRTSDAIDADKTEQAAARLGTWALGNGPSEADRCRIVACLPDRVEVDAEVSEPGGLLVLSDLYYPGWQA